MLEDPKNFAVPLFPPPTSLDPPETKSPIPVPDLAAEPPLVPTASIAFRHSGWSTRRTLVRAALVSAGIGDKRIAAFDGCGHGGWVWRSEQDPNVFKVTADHCHDRWCLPCGAARGRAIARNLAEIVKDKRIRFVTLTLARRNAPLKDTLKNLGNYFGRLRRSKFWQAAVTGGAAFLEIKRSKDGAGWHPHLHIVAEGKYLHQGTLKAIWHRITGDSYIVDVRAVKNTDQLVRYVTKYVSKPLDSSIFNDHATTVQAIEAMHGRRTCTTFGAWRGQDLTTVADDTEWISVGPLSELLTQAAQGDEDARFVLARLSVESIGPRTPET